MSTVTVVFGTFPTPLRSGRILWYTTRRWTKVLILFGRGAVVAQLTVNQLVAGSNPAARANEARIKPLYNEEIARPPAGASEMRPYLCTSWVAD